MALKDCVLIAREDFPEPVLTHYRGVKMPELPSPLFWRELHGEPAYRSIDRRVHSYRRGWITERRDGTFSVDMFIGDENEEGATVTLPANSVKEAVDIIVTSLLLGVA